MRRGALRDFDPVDFLKIADELALRPDEASHRTAISRAYYGAFLLTRERLLLIIPALVKYRLSPEIHRALVVELRRRGRRDIADRLRELRRMRNISDYDISTKVAQADARYAIELANIIISRVRGLA